MEIIINSVNFKADTALETFVGEKLSKLFHQCNKIIRANVTLRETEKRNPENRLCEIKLMIPGNDYFIRKSTAVYEKSILQAVEGLQKTIRTEKIKAIRKRYFQNA